MSELVTLNCSQAAPAPATAPAPDPALLLCRIVQAILASNRSEQHHIPPYPASVPYNPWARTRAWPDSSQTR